MINLNMSELKNFSANAIYYREQAGLNKSEACRITGLDPSGLAKIESGHTLNPSLGAVVALSKAYGVSIEEMVYGENLPEDQPFDPFYVVPFHATDAMIEAGEMAMSSIPPQPKEEIRDIWQAMLFAWKVESDETEEVDADE